MSDIFSLALGGLNFLSGAYQNYSNNYWNHRNFGLQQDAFDYVKKQNTLTQQREDTAIQRRRADLEAAGMSPWLAAGGSAEASHAISPTAPQMGKQEYGEGLARFNATMANRTAIQQMKANVAQTEAETDLINMQVKAFDERIERERQSHTERMEHINFQDEQIQQRVLNMVRDYQIALERGGYTREANQMLALAQALTEIIRNIRGETQTSLLGNEIQHAREIVETVANNARQFIEKTGNSLRGAASAVRELVHPTMNAERAQEQARRQQARDTEEARRRRIAEERAEARRRNVANRQHHGRR